MLAATDVGYPTSGGARAAIVTFADWTAEQPLATHTVQIDEVAPYAWHGAQAFQTWATDLQNNDKSLGITDEHVAVGAATRVETTGDAAYVIVPAVYTFKDKGVAMRANAQMTVVLKKGADGWLIHGWTWTGPRAHKVTAAGE